MSSCLVMLWVLNRIEGGVVHPAQGTAVVSECKDVWLFCFMLVPGDG